MTQEPLFCPNDHGEMSLEKKSETIEFRGESITIDAERFRCAECGLEAGTPEQTKAIQKAISDAYRRGVSFLTGGQISRLRKDLGLSQQNLADEMSVGIASIKRWEGSSIQTASMDKALRSVLCDESIGSVYTGNREFSLPRVKLVIRELEGVLASQLLRKNDRLLFTAKYLWYADMVAYRELGKSMTGSTYAALPLGPQLNNYSGLIDKIIKADEKKTEPLTKEEKAILRLVAQRFPKKRDVYRAAHEEKIWKDRGVGTLIPYSASRLLTRI